MNLEKQVTSPNASRHLNDIGLRRKCQFGWLYMAGPKRYVLKNFGLGKNLLRAYTLSELGDIIPFGHFSTQPVIKISGGLWTLREDADKGGWETQVDALAWYLFKLIKSGELSIEDLNKT